MKKFNILLVIAMLFSMVSFAQKDRFVKPIFSSVKSTMGIPYCENYTFEPFLLQQPNTHTKKIQLKCDFYEPTGDQLKKRPLVIFLHTGNFIPQPSFGGSTEGRTTDSVLVELSTRLAKMGYACASADYRIGWAPTSTDETTRKFTLINAAYRGVQDIRSCIRFFKLNADKYGVDTTRITVFGSGTGGYISLAAASLDKYTEIFANTKPAGKFVLNPNPFTPMVIENFNGNINGTNLGVAAVDFGVPKGDTMCIPSNLGPTSNFHLAVNLGGALGDLSWLDKNSVPTISYHTPNDFYAPYKEAVLKVVASATAVFDIVNVMGSYNVQKKQDSLNINAKWKALKLNDVYSQAANKLNDGYDGLCPIAGLKPQDSSPWNWWDVAYWSNIKHPSVAGASIHQVALQGAPLTTATRGKLYCDTIIGYFAPRAYAQLDLAKLLPAQVTFSVDMKNEKVDPAKGVCIAGDFQKAAGFPADWTPGTTKLTNKAGTTIWEYTASLPAGNYEFKFINDDGWNGKEEKMSGKGCYAGDNRTVTVGTADMKVGTFCYNSCFNCGEYPVKLTVDMSKEAAIDPAGVYVAGAFQGWDPAKTKMNQVGTTKVYTLTVGMTTGDQEYKFVNGNAWGKDESIAAGAACGKSGGTNRYIKLNNGGYNAGEVCFKLCTKCDGSPSGAVGTNDPNFDNALTVSPNPTAGDLTVSYNFSEEVSNMNVRIINALGQVVAERTIKNANAGNTVFNLSNVPAGFYTVVTTNGVAYSSKRVIVQK
jgi:Secretion system C-terminal sorting domain